MKNLNVLFLFLSAIAAAQTMDFNNTSWKLADAENPPILIFEKVENAVDLMEMDSGTYLHFPGSNEFQWGNNCAAQYGTYTAESDDYDTIEFHMESGCAQAAECSPPTEINSYYLYEFKDQKLYLWVSIKPLDDLYPAMQEEVSGYDNIPSLKMPDSSEAEPAVDAAKSAEEAAAQGEN